LTAINGIGNRQKVGAAAGKKNAKTLHEELVVKDPAIALDNFSNHSMGLVGAV
jgi:hypothetical protein